MDFGTCQLEPGLVLDSRRALWLPEHQTLAIADLHLGYSWAHRSRGQMFPLESDDWEQRLASLIHSYQPQRIMIMGDVVHETLDAAAFQKEFARLFAVVSCCPTLSLIAGNHDRKLSAHSPVPLHRQVSLGEHLFLHGDQPALEAPPGRIFTGHEHPALCLGDGVTGGAKFPCFLAGKKAMILPAFSRWAAGTPIGSGAFLSPINKMARFDLAIAIMGKKLLPVPLKRGEGGLYRPCSSRA